MFSFRKEDPDEDIPAINIGGVDDSPGSKRYSEEKLSSSRRASKLPTPKGHNMQGEIRSSTSPTQPPSVSLPPMTGNSPIAADSSVDPFRFLEAEPVDPANGLIMDENHSMSPTLRTALNSCSNLA
jgi:hypothetical protein